MRTRKPSTRTPRRRSASTSTPALGLNVDGDAPLRATLTPDTRPAAERINAQGGTGYLTSDDIPHLDDAERRVFALLADGQEHGAAEIMAAVGGYDPLRRARALRGRRAHIDGRDVLLNLTCRRGPNAAGIYRMTFTPVDRDTQTS